MKRNENTNTKGHEMEKTYQTARRRLGIPAFERDCRLTSELGRMKKAYRVPGTSEAGRYQMMLRMASEESARLDRGEPGIFG
jgi:hypothetical protein